MSRGNVNEHVVSVGPCALDNNGAGIHVHVLY